MTKPDTKARLGVDGLDDITVGGLQCGRLFLLEGSPGTGKTTIATQFLIAGAAAGERALYITLSETEDELRAGALSHGWSLEGIDIFELVPPESLLDEQQQQSLLYSSDLELGETTRRIFEAFERVKPQRVVLASLSEIRLLAQSSLRYRRQILALKHYFARSGATVLMLDDLSSEANDRTMHSVAHGVIRLDELSPEYGAERRRLRVIKYRGQRYRGGYHGFGVGPSVVRSDPGQAELIGSAGGDELCSRLASSGGAEIDGIRRAGRLPVREGRAQLLLDGLGVDIADNHDRRIVRPVVGAIISAHPVVGRAPDRFHRADRPAIDRARTVQNRVEVRLHGAELRCVAETLFGQHNALFGVDRCLRQNEALTDLAEQLEAGIERGGVGLGEVEHEFRSISATNARHSQLGSWRSLAQE